MLANNNSFFGMGLIPEVYRLEYGYILLVIAGSDGEVSEQEIGWLVNKCAKSLNIDDEIIEKWKTFDFQSADLEQLFFSINRNPLLNFNLLLVYDAIRMSSADGEYSLDEKEMVMKVSKKLQLSEDKRVMLESLVALERMVEDLRNFIF